MIKKIISFLENRPVWVDLLFILAAVIPSFISLLNNQYFSMHDDQHIARLFLFDRALREGVLYPRWVDLLGFNYGYPLFNFYPPLIYFVGEFYHLLGFSFIWSIKLVVITGFLLAAWGMYLYVKQLYDKNAGIVAAVLYTYFFYHAVISFVRGALAEFFAISLIPFVFYAIDRLGIKVSIRNVILFAVMFGLLVINHPLIAFPAVFFLGFYFLRYVLFLKNRWQFAGAFIGSVVLGLMLSAFFWLPSIVEKQYTLVDDILTKELASYNIHFVYLQQFWYSAWGFGGSIAGPFDGMTFQLGKVHLFFALISIAAAVLFTITQRKNESLTIRNTWFMVLLLAFSLWMTTALSSFVWDNIQFLSYLQFPWRFLTFVGFFISVVGGFFFYSIRFYIPKKLHLLSSGIIFALVVMTSVGTIGIYKKYFKPQELRNVTDAQMTSFEEIAWRISRTSFEFSPKGIKTVKSELNTSILPITKETVPTKPALIVQGIGTIDEVTHKSNYRVFNVNAETKAVIGLNTFNFPGWKAEMKDKNGKVTPLKIEEKNEFKLMMVDVPQGEYTVIFRFTDTPVRTAGNLLTIIGVIVVVVLLYLSTKKGILLIRKFK